MKEEPADGLVVAASAGVGGLLAELAAGNGVAGTVAGALAPIGVQVADRLLFAVRQRRASKIETTLAAAGLLDAGIDILDERRPGYDERVELLGRVMEAAGRSTFEAKLQALGRVLREGLADKGNVSEAIILAAALAVVEPPHVVLLQYLDEHPRPPETEAPPGGKPRFGWQAAELPAALPELESVLAALLAVLGGQGLIREMPGQTYPGSISAGRWVVTPLGKTCLFLLDEERES